MMTLPIDSIDLSQYSQAELLQLRGRVSSLLPSKLADLNLEEELLTQLLLAKQLVIDAEEAPANQRAQCANTITSVLTKIVDMQTALSTTETIKKMERTLIDTLRSFPQLQADFMERYEQSIS